MVAIGIDLGTTNSVGARSDGDSTHITLPSSRPDCLVPSVVCLNKGRILIGQTALDFAPKDPKNAIFSIKRLMGRTFDESKVEELRNRVNYSIVKASDGSDPGVRVALGDKEYTPTDISAMILKQIKDDAEKALGSPVTHAVITVPAYFEERQRAATRKAGEQAGLIVKRIIDEPSAAAIAYGFTISKGARKKILVFDLGGGTFDISIIMTVKDPKGRNHFEVLEGRGDNWLGGDDFDREIVKEITAHIAGEYKFSPAGDPNFELLAKQAAERAKIALSNATETEITLPTVYAVKAPDGRVVDLDMRLTRDRFEQLIRPYVERCITGVKLSLEDQAFEPEDIDVVLLVGGTTLVPLVRESVAALFGAEKVKVTNPFHAVAIGASILAATLAGVQCPSCGVVADESDEICKGCGEGLAGAASVGGFSITEQTLMAFGISAVREDQPDAFEVIIPKGTVYPLKSPIARTFETTTDDFIQIPVYEGVEVVATKNEQQGVIELGPDDFKDAGVKVPAGTMVDVSMTYTRNRELLVQVRVHGTSVKKDFFLRRDRARMADAPADLEKLTTGLNHLLGVSEDMLNDYKVYMEARESRKLEGAMELARKALNSGIPREIQEASGKLTVALDSCGTASLLFLAERVRSGASPERANRIQEAVSKIKRAWGEGRPNETMTEILRAAISAEISMRQQHRPVPGYADFGGRLRVRDR